MVLETHKTLCVTELDYPEKIFYHKKLENVSKMGLKQGFLNLLKTLVINFD